MENVATGEQAGLVLSTGGPSCRLYRRLARRGALPVLSASNSNKERSLARDPVKVQRKLLGTCRERLRVRLLGKI